MPNQKLKGMNDPSNQVALPNWLLSFLNRRIKSIVTEIKAIGRVLGPSLLIVSLSQILFGQVTPWQPAQNELNQRQYSFILLGGARGASSKDELHVEKSYILVDIPSWSSITLTVTILNDETPKVTTKSGGFLGSLIILISGLVLIWWFYFRGWNEKSPLAKNILLTVTALLAFIALIVSSFVLVVMR